MLSVTLIFVVIGVVTCSSNVQRTDNRFVGHSLPYTSSHSYSAQEWNELICNMVDVSNVENVRQQVQNQLRQFGVDPYSGVPRANGSTVTFSLNTFSGICDSVLTLYTLGHPLHSGALFYPGFNSETRQAIQKTIRVHDYDYALDYVLINHTFWQRSTTVHKPLYRGVNISFNMTTGATFRFNQFASCSANHTVASHSGFLQPGGTFFVIQGAQALNMSNVSQYPQEQEYLVHPFEEFNVHNVSNVPFNGGYIANVTLVHSGYSYPQQQQQQQWAA